MSGRQNGRLVQLCRRFWDWLTEPIFTDEEWEQFQLETRRPPGQTQLHWFEDGDSDE